MHALPLHHAAGVPPSKLTVIFRLLRSLGHGKFSLTLSRCLLHFVLSRTSQCRTSEMCAARTTAASMGLSRSPSFLPAFGC